MEEFCRPVRAWKSSGRTDPGRRLQTRFALGYFLSGFQPLQVLRESPDDLALLVAGRIPIGRDRRNSDSDLRGALSRI